MGIISVPEGTSREERFDRLMKTLDDLSQRQIASRAEYCEYVGFFLSLYGDESFRHRYSDILDVLVSDGDARKTMERSSCLSENLHTLASHEPCEACGGGCRKNELAENRQYFKLCDHVDLEARRFALQNRAALDADDNADRLKREIGELRSRLRTAEREARASIRKAELFQRETVAILGIFAAIVVTFSAAASFTTSAIGPMSVSDTFSIVFVTSMVGLVLFNALFVLLTFLYRMVRSNRGVWDLISKSAFVIANAVILSCVVVAGALVSFGPWG